MAGVDGSITVNGYGSIYGIPEHAHKRIKFNPLNKFITHIGPDFGDDIWNKWRNGVMAENKVIYCPPDNIDRGILRIDTKTDVVTELDVDLHPKRGDENNAFHAMWKSCALALDGCIYFMPYDARHIMKLDPNNNDAMISIGDDVYYRRAFVGTVGGIDSVSMGYLVDPVAS